MEVYSTCPKCNCRWNWVMNQTERTPEGGRRPVASPNCPRCQYDVTGANERAPRDLAWFAKHNDVAQMKRILAPALGNLFGLLRPNPNQANEGGFTPLMIAALYGQKEAVQCLLEFGAKIDAVNKGKDTALNIAEQYGHKQVAELLKSWNGTPKKVAAIELPIKLPTAKFYDHEYTIATNARELAQVLDAKERLMFQFRTTEYMKTMQELTKLMEERFGKGSPEHGAILTSPLVCPQCTVLFPDTWKVMATLGRASGCPGCGSGEVLLVFEVQRADEITEADVTALRHLWRDRAVAWWKKQSISQSQCSYSMACDYVQNGDGYFPSGRIYCNACAEKKLSSALENLRNNVNYFGMDELRQARQFAKDHPDYQLPPAPTSLAPPPPPVPVAPPPVPVSMPKELPPAKLTAPTSNVMTPVTDSVLFQCSKCGKKLKAKAELAGKKIRCTGCKEIQVVIGPASPQPVKPPADPFSFEREKLDSLMKQFESLPKEKDMIKSTMVMALSALVKLLPMSLTFDANDDQTNGILENSKKTIATSAGMLGEGHQAVILSREMLGVVVAARAKS